jgi:hypothetical protein
MLEIGVFVGFFAGTATTLAGAFINDLLARRRDRRDRLRTKYEAIYEKGLDARHGIVELMKGVNDAIVRDESENFAREFWASANCKELQETLKTVYGQNLSFYLLHVMLEPSTENWSKMAELFAKMQERLDSLAQLADVPPTIEVLAMDSR